MRLAVAVLLPLIVAFSLATSCLAQSLTLTPEQTAAIDAVFARETISTTSPGCGLALICDGSIVHFRGYGLADVEKGVA